MRELAGAFRTQGENGGRCYMYDNCSGCCLARDQSGMEGPYFLIFLLADATIIFIIITFLIGLIMFSLIMGLFFLVFFWRKGSGSVDFSAQIHPYMS
jgi:hypothetical protein